MKKVESHEISTRWSFDEDDVEDALRKVFNIPDTASFEVLFEDFPEFVLKEFIPHA